MQAVADLEVAVVVHEGDQVNAAVLPLEDKRDQVGLPELVGPRPLEVPHVVGVATEAVGGKQVTQLISALGQSEMSRVPLPLASNLATRATT